MCNLYAVTRAQDAIRALFRVTHDTAGNLPSLPGIFPDQYAPVIRSIAGGRALTRMLWGFPPPPNAGKRPVTNIRNAASAFWRPWLKPDYRVLVPFTSFCEYEEARPRKIPTWFALSEARPLAAFAGICRPWHGERKGEARAHEVFGFLTTEASSDVRAIHPAAMPVVLTDPAEFDLWLSAPVNQALTLQRPLPDGALRVVARGELQDDFGNNSGASHIPSMHQGETP